MSTETTTETAAGPSGWRDVTRPLRPDMETFPGDPGIEMELARSRAAGDPANVTRLDMGAHTGTHVDAPVHFVDGGEGVESLPLDALEGPAQVVDARSPAQDTGEIDAGEIDTGEIDAARLAALDLPADVERLLLVTGGATLAEDAATLLADRGLRLLGVDHLSVGGPETHRALFAADIVVLEGLDLGAAPPGRYRLRCLPLLIPGADGAPARALLRPEQP
jgi:arylformamidase